MANRGKKRKKKNYGATIKHKNLAGNESGRRTSEMER